MKSVVVFIHTKVELIDILGSFLLQTVYFVGVAILHHFQEHLIHIVLVLELNEDMALVARRVSKMSRQGQENL